MTVALSVVNIYSDGIIMKQLVHVYAFGMGAVTVTVTVLVQKRSAFRPVANKVSPLSLRQLCIGSVGESYLQKLQYRVTPYLFMESNALRYFCINCFSPELGLLVCVFFQ